MVQQQQLVMQRVLQWATQTCRTEHGRSPTSTRACSGGCSCIRTEVTARLHVLTPPVSLMQTDQMRSVQQRKQQSCSSC
jgi:hypothetical protein